MKQSVFNILFEEDKQNYLLNTFSKKIVKISDEKKYALTNNSWNNDKTFCSKLKNYGFIVNEFEEKFDGLSLQCNKLVNSKTLHITMMMNYQCNFKCIYCFQNHINNSFMNEETIQNTIMFVEKQIIDKNIKRLYVEWFGGEPLLNKCKLIKVHKTFLELSNKYKIPYYSRITTNGYELDLNTFKDLYKNHCFIYYISLDGIKQTHDYQRPHKSGEGTYEKIIFNLSEIHKKIENRNFRIEIRINNSAQTIKNMIEFMLEFKELFQDDNRFVLVLDSVQDWGEKTKSIQNDLIKKNEIDDLAMSAKRLGVNLSTFSLKNIETQICQAAKRNAYSIFYNGDILKCQMALENPQYRKINIIGNVLDGVFHNKEELWVNDVLEYSCKDCVALPLCYGQKCVYATRIKKENCFDIKRKFIEQIKLEGLSLKDAEEI